MKKILVVFFLVLSVCSFAQDESDIFLPEGLSLFNQMKYSYDTKREIEIFENWLNLDYRNGIFSTGFRFDLFQPNDPNPAVHRGKKRYSEISFKYIKAEIGDKNEGAELTVGNFYTLFGRGMTLKIYEDRNIRIDNNLLGVLLKTNYMNFTITALSGMPENLEQKRTEALHALDIEYRRFRDFKIGFSILSNKPENDNVARTSLASMRINPRFWNFELYSEFGIKRNEDIKKSVFNGEEKIVGKGFYSNLSFYYENFSILGEYKLYDNFGFSSSDGTVQYNTPPATRRDYPYGLVLLHPSALDANNEEGFQVEINYNIENTSFLSSYGLTKTLPTSSYYQRINNRNVEPVIQFKEFYSQLAHQWSDVLYTTVALAYSEELVSDTKSITPVLDLRYSLNPLNTLRFIYEHQQATVRYTNEKFYTQSLTVEFLRSPLYTISFNGVMETKEPVAGKKERSFWRFIQLAYKVANHSDLILLVGSRIEGYLCVGGVCRYEPEFNGVELKLFIRL